MKNPWIAGIALFLLGTGVGWVSRGSVKGDSAPDARTAAAPHAASPQKEPAASASSTAPATPGKRAIREPEPKKDKPERPEVDTEAITKHMSRELVKRQRAKFEKHTERLAEALSLNEAQKAGLDAWIEERLAGIESIDFTKPETIGGKDSLFSDLSLKSLEEKLEGTLNDEQKVAFTAFRERDRQARVDSLALKRLSQIQGVIEFDEGQRDKVYEILAEGAAGTIDREQDKKDPSAIFTEGMGIDMDPYGLGIQDAMQEAFGDTTNVGGAPDRKQMAAKLREVIDGRIEAKVEQLRPVLNERQLEQYRAELRNKGTGFLSSALMGLEAADGEDTHMVIPVN